MVLPEGIELSTSPFITLTLSCPLHPHAGHDVRALDHPFIISSCEPLDATRLVSTPSLATLLDVEGLARDCRWSADFSAGQTVSPNLGGDIPIVSGRAGKTYQGSALPLSYGSLFPAACAL